MATAKQMSLNLLVDKEMNRLLYAECGKDIVDILLSFLTMPVGTVIRLAGKQSEIGCLSKLYESVEQLDVSLLQTEASKNGLLHPKSASEELCKNLKVNIDDTKPTEYYICTVAHCTEIHQLISTVANAQCPCGKLMTYKVSKRKLADGRVGVFLKGNNRFMITDDLQVSVVSSTTSFRLLREHGISDVSVLEERNVNVGATEVLHLLKRLLLSKKPLTEVFMGEHNTTDGEDHNHKDMALDSKDLAQQSQAENDTDSDSGKISLKLFLSKSNKKVLYAEGGEEFSDFLFSFLAFPLGFIVKCLDGCTTMGCLDNLYKSVEDLNFKDCMKSEECKAMLLDPKLAPNSGCKNQLLQIEEQVQKQSIILHCNNCPGSVPFITDDGPLTCSHGKKSIQLSTMTQKSPDMATELERGFMAGPAMFMVTDELVVKQLSPISGISLLSKSNIPISDIEEQVVSMGEEEAMSLLKASLISKSVLSDVFDFDSKNLKQLGMRSYKKEVANDWDVIIEI